MYIKNHLPIASIILLMMSIISGCLQKSTEDNTVIPIVSEDSITKNEHDSICFTKDILPIFKSNCAIEACHDGLTGQEGIVFDSYETFFYKGFVPGDARQSQVYNAIIRTTSRRMPPIPKYPLDSIQIGMIAKWINQGMRENSCNQKIDTTQFSYQKNIFPIINNYCFGCHNDRSEYPNGILIQTYEQVKLLANNGKLLGTIKHQNGYKPMPENGSQMDPISIRMIEKWIEYGALNN